MESQNNLAALNVRSDEDIVREVRQLCERFRVTPGVALCYLRAALNQKQCAVDQLGSPIPEYIEEFVLSQEPFNEWPEWASQVLPPNSKFELLTYSDGKRVARVCTPRGLTLLAQTLDRS